MVVSSINAILKGQIVCTHGDIEMHFGSLNCLRCTCKNFGWKKLCIVLVYKYFRPPSGMAVSRSYPRHFFPFCEKKRKAFCLLFSSFPSFSFHLLCCISSNVARVPEGHRRSPKVTEGPRRSLKVPEGPRRFPKVPKGYQNQSIIFFCSSHFD